MLILRKHQTIVPRRQSSQWHAQPNACLCPHHRTARPAGPCRVAAEDKVDTSGQELNGRHRSPPADTLATLADPSPWNRNGSVAPSIPVVSADMLPPEAIQAPATQVPTIICSRPLPRVLILHTGGTLGMDVTEAQAEQAGSSAGNTTYGGLRPAAMLANVLSVVPELRQMANAHLHVAFNKDSSRVGPADWIEIARILDANRFAYDAFMIIHGTDTMAYTASALSLMLRGFRRPVVLTGSQLPLAAPRTDARQNLLDALQCATASFSPPHINLQEVAICFGGRLMRGNRCRKVHSSSYQAFDSPGFPHLAQLGIDVAWNERVLLHPDGAYVPRFRLDPHVIRVPVVPGCDPRQSYGDLAERGIRGIVLELFGVGNLPDLDEFGWLPWIRDQMHKGLQIAIVSQCTNGGFLQPDIYAAGGALSSLSWGTSISGLVSTPAAACTAQFMSGSLGSTVAPGGGMTPECAVVKLMLCLAYPSLAVGESIAGEL